MQIEDLLYYIIYYIKDVNSNRYVAIEFDETVAYEHAGRLNRDAGTTRYVVAREPLQNAILRAINATR